MFCTSVRGVVENILEKEEVVICRETAASFLGLSNGWGIPVKVYANKDIISSKYVQCVGRLGEEVNRDNIIRVNNIRCISKEQAICEMILYDCCEQEIIESMANYYFERGENFGNELLEVASDLGVINELEQYMDDAIHYYDD